jgi:hypothetical protein
MKDCKTFLKLQEAAGNKQAEARRQGYEGNTNNTPSSSQQANNRAAQGQNQPNQGNDNEGGYIPSKGHIVAMIQPVPKSNKEEKSISRQVNLVVTLPQVTTEYLHSSEQPIEFNREDHPIIVPRPGNAPLVLKAQIGGYDIERVFMDARSGINLIYAKNTSSNAHINGVPETNRPLFPWNRTRKHQLPIGSNSTRRLLRQLAPLCAPFSDKEISDALYQIGPLKAPRPDGFLACFLQRNWDLLKVEVILAVQKFFSDGVILDGVNDTTIALIPKKEDPAKLKDFRPIGLCNVTFKVVSKCLVNWLRPLLHDIIAPVQSAFIPGHLITDNALIAFECIHAIQTGPAACRKFCAYKLDMAKVYDCVDWQFLEGVLAKLGFHSQWVQWVMACVTTMRYTIRCNGNMVDSFTPSRGIRQGDPLSLYLFLFVTDGLSCLIRKEIEMNSLQEFHICQRAPGISHLLFADDSILFFEALVEQALVIKSIIDRYEEATGSLLVWGSAQSCMVRVALRTRKIN